MGVGGTNVKIYDQDFVRLIGLVVSFYAFARVDMNVARLCISASRVYCRAVADATIWVFVAAVDKHYLIYVCGLHRRAATLI